MSAGPWNQELAMKQSVVLSTDEEGGAGDGIRTRDILLGKQTLCQLSYSRSAYAQLERLPSLGLTYSA